MSLFKTMRFLFSSRPEPAPVNMIERAWAREAGSKLDALGPAGAYDTTGDTVPMVVSPGYIELSQAQLAMLETMRVPAQVFASVSYPSPLDWRERS